MVLSGVGWAVLSQVGPRFEEWPGMFFGSWPVQVAGARVEVGRPVWSGGFALVQISSSGECGESVCSSLTHVWLFATAWTVDHQAPLAMGFSRQEYWSG